MPPKSAVPKNARAAFKPPRPINPSLSNQSSAPQRQTTTGSHTAEKATGEQRRSKGRTVTSSISDSEDEGNASGIDGADPTGPNDMGSLSSVGTAIPPQLLARLLHEHFEHGETRITKEAMSLFGRYIDLFAREAIARAINERRETSTQGRGTGVGIDFLEVEDLEKLAPQLLLDFQ